MTQQTWPGASRPAGPGRSRWWPALWAAVIAFTVVVSSGAVLFAYQRLDDGSRPAPPAAGGASDRISPLRAATTATTAAPSTASATSRLELIGPRTVIDTRRGDGPLPAGVAMDVPLTGVPRDSTAVLVEVSILKAGKAGAVALISGDETTPVLRAPRAGAQTSATVVAPLDGDGEDLRVRTEGGGHLVVTLTGAFTPATSSAAGRFLAVDPAEALVLRPGQDGNRATIRAADLPLGGVPRDSVGALLLSFRADVGTHGGTVAVGPSRDALDQQVFWGATSGSDRTRGGFLVVPVAKSLKLYYHAGTKLVVTVVGVVTGEDAPNGTAGLSVPLRSRALPEQTVPEQTGHEQTVSKQAVQDGRPAR